MPRRCEYALDRIVLGAPCTGLRTLRRHPEIGQRRQLKNCVPTRRPKDACFKPRSTFCSRAELGVFGLQCRARRGRRGDRTGAGSDVRLVERPGLPAGQGCFGLNGEGDGFYVAVLERFMTSGIIAPSLLAATSPASLKRWRRSRGRAPIGFIST